MYFENLWSVNKQKIPIMHEYGKNWLIPSNEHPGKDYQI